MMGGANVFFFSSSSSSSSSDDDSSDKGYTNRGDFVDVAEVTSGK